MHYAKEIVDILTEMDQKEKFDRLFLVGSQETMVQIESALTPPLAAKLAGKQNVDFSAGDDQIFDTAFDLFFTAERDAEAKLWDKIKDEVCRGGLAVTGPEEVLKAAAVGRVEKIAVTRDAKLPGTRCRDCENLSSGDAQEVQGLRLGGRLPGRPGQRAGRAGRPDQRRDRLRRSDRGALGGWGGGGVAAVLGQNTDARTNTDKQDRHGQTGTGRVFVRVVRPCSVRVSLFSLSSRRDSRTPAPSAASR